MNLRPLEGPSPAKGDVFTIELESGTTPVSRFSIKISTSRDDRVERAYGRFIRQGFYQTEYFTVGSIIIFVKKKDGSFSLRIDYIDLKMVSAY